MGDLRFGKRKMWLILAVMLFVLNGILFFRAQIQDSTYDSKRAITKQYQVLIEEHQSSSYSQIYQQLMRKFKNLLAESIRSWVENRQQRDGVDEQTAALSLFTEQLEQLLNYKNIYPLVVKNAENMLKFSIFSGEGTFAKNNIDKTVSDYAYSQSIRLSLVNGRAIEAFATYSMTDFIVFAVLFLYVLFAVFQYPKDMLLIVRSTKNGRWNYALKRFGRTTLVVGSVVLLFYGSNLIYSQILYGGCHQLFAAIQSIGTFQNFTHAFSIFKVLTLIFILKFIGCMISVMIWSWIGVMIDNIKLAAFISVLWVAFQYAAAQMKVVSFPLNMFKYLNVFSFINIQQNFMEYLNVNVAGQAVSAYELSAVAAVILFLVCALLWCTTCACRRTQQNGARFLRFKVLIERFHLPAPGLMGMELYKVFWVQKGLIVLLVFVWLQYQEINWLPVQYSGADAYINYLCMEFEGEPTDGGVERLNEISAELTMKLSDDTIRIEMAELYQAQQLGLEVFTENYQRCLLLHKQGENTGIVSPYGFRRLTFMNNWQTHVWGVIKGIGLILFVLIQMMRIEETSKMRYLMHLTDRGSKRVRRNKHIIMWLTVGAAGLLMFGTEWYNVLSRYSVSGWGYSVHSLETLSGYPLSIPIYVYFGVMYMIKLLIFIAAGEAVFRIGRVDEQI